MLIKLAYKKIVLYGHVYSLQYNLQKLIMSNVKISDELGGETKFNSQKV